MIKAKVDGKTKLIPDRLEELTFHQLLRLKRGENYLKIFTGVHEKDWRLSPDVKSFNNLMLALAWVSTIDEANLKQYGAWHKLTYKDVEYNLKKDIRLETVGQYLDFMEEAAGKEDHVRNYALYTAIYLQPQIDGDYSYKKARRLEVEIKKLPWWVVLQAGNFFLLNSLKLKNGKKTIFRPEARRRPLE